MGTATEEIQRVVNDILASRDARSAARRELARKTRDDLAEVLAERRRGATALRNALAGGREERFGSERARRLEARHFRASVREFLDEMKVRLSEMCSDTHNLLRRYEMEREEGGDALREALISQRTGRAAQEKARRDAVLRGRQDARRFLDEVGERVSEMRGETRQLLHGYGEELRETASDLRQAGRIWRERGAREAPGEAPVLEAVTLTLEDQVLQVVQRHPGGIRLVEIGNELGMNWRLLIGPSKALVDAARIEKVEKTYYPVD